MSSVDDIWDDMQREEEVRFSSICRREQLHAKAPDLNHVVRKNEQQPAQRHDADATTWMDLDLVQIAHIMKRCVSSLRDEDASVRGKAIRKIAAFLDAFLTISCTLNSDDAKKAITLKAIAREVLKPILKCTNDRAERNRLASIESLQSLISVLDEDEIVRQLPYIIPVIRYRLVNEAKRSEDENDFLSFTRREMSEDVCLQLVSVIQLVMQKAGKSLAPFVSDLCICISTLMYRGNDSRVIIASCESMTLLCNQVPSSVREHSKALITLSRCNLTNKRGAVRLASVKLIEKLVYCGAAESIRDLQGFRERNVIPIKAFYEGELRVNSFGMLVADSNAKVRKAFYEMMHNWRLNLPERLDYETLIMPYILSGIFDDIEEIRDKSFNAVEEIGALHEKEHEEDLDDWKRLSADVEIASRREIVLLPFLLVPPFQERPSLGARLVVRSQLTRLLPAIVSELEDWKDISKAYSLRLLKVLLFYAEEYMATQFQVICSSLLRVLGRKAFDADARHCCQLVCRYVHLDVLVPYVLDCISSSSDQTSVVAAFRFFAFLPEFSPPAFLTPHVDSIIEIVLSSDWIVEQSTCSAASHFIHAFSKTELQLSSRVIIAWSILRLLSSAEIDDESRILANRAWYLISEGNEIGLVRLILQRFSGTAKPLHSHEIAAVCNLAKLHGLEQCFQFIMEFIIDAFSDRRLRMASSARFALKMLCYMLDSMEHWCDSVTAEQALCVIELLQEPMQQENRVHILEAGAKLIGKVQALSLEDQQRIVCYIQPNLKSRAEEKLAAITYMANFASTKLITNETISKLLHSAKLLIDDPDCYVREMAIKYVSSQADRNAIPESTDIDLIIVGIKKQLQQRSEDGGSALRSAAKELLEKLESRGH